MLTRRHIRVKVMQVIYSLHKDENYNLPKGDRYLQQSLQQTRELYATLMDFCRAIYQKAQELDAEFEQKLHFSKEENIKNKAFISCKPLELIFTNESLSSLIEEHAKVNWQEHSEFVRMIYKEIISSETYSKYLKIEKPTFNKQKYLLSDLYTQIIAPCEKLFAFLEDKTLTWGSDFPLINTLIVRIIRGLGTEKDNFTLELFKDEDEASFGTQLLNRTILSDAKNQEYLVEKTPKWDTQRLADIDSILLKMAITEFLKFPNIPLKVTINEYVEIAKEYSTIKSGVFINGILDSLSKDLIAQGKIQKIGRGLY